MGIDIILYRLVSDLYFLASTVSSKMLRAVAEKEGLKFEVHTTLLL